MDCAGRTVIGRFPAVRRQLVDGTICGGAINSLVIDA